MATVTSTGNDDRIEFDLAFLALHLKALRRAQRFRRDIDLHVGERVSLAGESEAGGLVGFAQRARFHRRRGREFAFHQAHATLAACTHTAAHRDDVHADALRRVQKGQSLFNRYPSPDGFQVHFQLNFSIRFGSLLCVTLNLWLSNVIA